MQLYRAKHRDNLSQSPWYSEKKGGGMGGGGNMR
jgi:hypothetical protein